MKNEACAVAKKLCAYICKTLGICKNQSHNGLSFRFYCFVFCQSPKIYIYNTHQHTYLLIKYISFSKYVCVCISCSTHNCSNFDDIVTERGLRMGYVLIINLKKYNENIITIKLVIKVGFFLQILIQLLHKPHVKGLQRKKLEIVWVRVFFSLHSFVSKYAFSFSTNFHCTIQES